MTFQLHHRMIRAIAIGGLLLLVASAVAVFVRDAHDSAVASQGASPTATVREFLIAAAIDNDGVQACRYLTGAEQARAAQRAGAGRSCATAVSESALRLGGAPLTTESQVLRGVATAERATPAGVVVTLAHRGGSHSFLLVPATAAERSEFSAPAAPWRIAAGAAALVPRHTP